MKTILKILRTIKNLWLKIPKKVRSRIIQRALTRIKKIVA